MSELIKKQNKLCDNYYVLDHYIQKDILYALAFANSLKFSELKPDGLENKLFTYHLKKVISAGFTAKNSDGSYSLTPEGRRVGKGSFQKDSYYINRAYSILFLAIKRKSDGAWLLAKRKSQPLLGLTGFMQAKPLLDVESVKLASNVLQEKSGLDGNFNVISSGFFRIFKDDQMESFVNFTLLLCENAVGELEQNDEASEYYWDNSPNFSDSSMLPTMKTMSKLVDTRLPFIEEALVI